jgi:hypothetical protein
MNGLKTLRYTLVYTGLLLTVFSLILHGVLGYFQDGTPDTAFAIEPVSLLIGLGAGALVVGIPVLARAVAHRKGPQRKDPPGKDEDCDGKADYALKGRKGWDGTIKGSGKIVEDAPGANVKLINPVAMDKGLRIDASSDASSTAVSSPDETKPKTKPKQYTGHVTLMK